MKITGKTRLVCLLGSPVSHTLSPILHNALFSFFNMDWIYLAFDVKNLESSLKGLAALGAIGANITIPYKIEVMKYLTEIDKKAKRIGAVNTLVFKDNEIIGLNTDGDGFVRSIKENGFSLKDKNVLLLGAGGAGRAIAISLQDEAIKRLEIFDIKDERKESLVRAINKTEVIGVNKIKTKDIDILINATPLGMDESDPLPCEIEDIHPDLLVYDIVYHKDRKTRLLIDAEKKGIKTISGIEMLIYQGALSFEIWTGISPTIEVMRKVLDAGY